MVRYLQKPGELSNGLELGPRRLLDRYLRRGIERGVRDLRWRVRLEHGARHLLKWCNFH